MTQILDGFPLHDIGEDQLQSLVSLRVAESSGIEYKAELKMNPDKEKRELCKDVSAFANSQGGYLFFGIAANNGIPVSIPGIQFGDVMEQQLLQILNSGIAPRLQNLQHRDVSLRNGQKVLILKIDPDGGLHQVKYGDNRFYKRVGPIIITMESADIETFYRSADTSGREEEVEGLVEGYYASLKDKTYFKGTTGNPICTLVVVPEVPSLKLDLSSLPMNRFLTLFRPIYCSGWNSEVTGNSLFAFGRLERGQFGSANASHVPYAVTEITAFGEVKAYNSYMLTFSGVVPSTAYELEITDTFLLYLTSLRELGVSGPFFVGTALLNVQGYSLGINPRMMGSRSRVFEKDDIRPPLLRLKDDKKISTQQDAAKALHPLFDFVWREFGFERSFNYSEAGEYMPI